MLFRAWAEFEAIFGLKEIKSKLAQSVTVSASLYMDF